MKKVSYRSSWRRLDNTAKIFSLSVDDDMSVFRFSALLKDKIDIELLKRAVIKALEDYPMYRVKLGTGLFWNYLDFNDYLSVNKTNEITGIIICPILDLIGIGLSSFFIFVSIKLK